MPLISGNDFWTALAAILAALTIVYAAFSAGRTFGRREMKRALANDRESARFREIYAPIVGMFAECHITTVQSRGSPYFRQRARNAWEEMREGNARSALNALFDKQDSGVSGEVEYGNSFPLGRILKHLRDRERFADAKLILLVKHADRAQYEDRPDDNQLTDSDLELLEHVYREYALLARRFAGA
jgi:hypothetical protein